MIKEVSFFFFLEYIFNLLPLLSSIFLQALRWKTKSLTYQLGILFSEGENIFPRRILSVDVKDEEGTLIYTQKLDRGDTSEKFFTNPQFRWFCPSSDSKMVRALEIFAQVELSGVVKDIAFTLSLRRPHMEDQHVKGCGTLIQLGPPPNVCLSYFSFFPFHVISSIFFY